MRFLSILTLGLQIPIVDLSLNGAIEGPDGGGALFIIENHAGSQGLLLTLALAERGCFPHVIDPQQGRLDLARECGAA